MLFRYCPACGAQIYASLETSNATPEMFMDLFNSLYNLLADSHNAKRTEYFPPLSEKIIIRRAKLEVETDYNDMIRNLRMKFVPPNASAITGSYHQSLSNALAGYTFRSIEELIANKKSPLLSETEKHSIMSTMFKESASDLHTPPYNALDSNNLVDNRVLFCFSIRWNNGHLKYMLADKDYNYKLFAVILSDAITMSIETYGKVIRSFIPDANIQEIVNRKRRSIEDNTQQDLLFGYIVRLCESLSPY